MFKLVDDRLTATIEPFEFGVNILNHDWWLHCQAGEWGRITVLSGVGGVQYKTMLSFLTKLWEADDGVPGVCSTPVDVRTEPVK